MNECQKQELTFLISKLFWLERVNIFSLNEIEKLIDKFISQYIQKERKSVIQLLETKYFSQWIPDFLLQELQHEVSDSDTFNTNPNK